MTCPSPGWVDPATHHCYFGLPAAGFDRGMRACAAQGAHLVTFVSEAELAQVTNNAPVAGSAAPYWVGLRKNDDDAYISVANEPGWAPLSRCAGCFGKPPRFDARDLEPASALSGGAPVECVVARPNEEQPWERAPCDAAEVSVVCEREPAGSRAQACNGATCVRLSTTMVSGKRYLYVPVPATADDAAQACTQLTNGKLLVLSSREEREQLFVELGRAGILGVSPAFWLGLSRETVTTPVLQSRSWTWEDGTLAGVVHPLPWATEVPDPWGPARAYVLQAPGTYDNQLAHADPGVSELPYVCEYYP